MKELELLNTGAFSELSQEEMLDTDGGVLGTVCAVIGTIIAVGTAVYKLGEAHGKRDGYRARYGY